MRKLMSLLLGIGWGLAAASPTALADGPCCLGDDSCIDTSLAGCDQASGEFLGERFMCTATTICQGACCLADKACAQGIRDDCDAAAGTFQGAGTNCDQHCAAQVPLFKMWITEVYEVNLDGTYTAKCVNDDCPTQDLPPGIAQPGDLINIEVTVEGWDASTDSGRCHPEKEVCSVSAQDCADSHCSGEVTRGQCTADSNCFLPDTCDPDTCEKSPLLGAFQWRIDSSTYSIGGAAPGLAPAQLACTSDADCACAYTAVEGDFNDCADFAAVNPGFCTCAQTGTCDGNVCGPAAAAYIDSSSLPNYVFFRQNYLATMDLNTLDYEFAAFSLDLSLGGVAEEQFRCNASPRSICNVDADCPLGTCEFVTMSPYYLGTLLLEVMGEPCGLYTLDLVQDTLANVPIATFLDDNNDAKMPNPIVETLLIGLGSALPCNDDDPCTLNDVFCGGECAGTPIVCDPGETCLLGVCQSSPECPAFGDFNGDGRVDLSDYAEFMKRFTGP